MPQNYKTVVMTEQGAKLLLKAAETGTKIKFTKMAIGDGTYTEDEKDAEKLYKVTALKEKKNEYEPSAVVWDGERSVKVTALISNQDPRTQASLINVGYYINEIGLFAKEETDPEGSTEVLYSIAVTAGKTGDYMPAFDETPSQIIQDYITVVDGKANVVLHTDNNATALARDIGKPNGMASLDEEGHAPDKELNLGERKVEFEAAAKRDVIKPTDSLKDILGKLAKTYTDLDDVAFSGAYKDLTGVPTNATESAPGLMSAADKKKLNGITEQANNYKLPAATSGALGGVKSGGDITVDASGVVAVNDNSHAHTITNVTGLQDALNKKLDASKAGVASGVAQLDAQGHVPQAQLPSYVDDVIEGYLNAGKFYKEAAHSNVIQSETGKIYVDVPTNKTYRWSGNAYVVISETLALGTTSSTAFAGDKGNTAYTHATKKGSAFASNLYKIATNEEGHVTAAVAATKEDITKLGIPGTDTKYTHPNSAAGAKTTSALYKITTDAQGHVTGATPVTKTDLTELGLFPTSGGTLTGDLNVGNNVTLRSDGEGGNIVLKSVVGAGGVSEKQQIYEIDTNGGNLRIHLNGEGGDGSIVKLMDKDKNSSFPGTVTAQAFNGNASTSTINFSSGDCTDEEANGWASLSKMTSGETHGALFDKVSRMFKNVRYLYKTLTSHVGDAVKHVTAAERTAWNGKANANHTHSYLPLTGGKIASGKTKGSGTSDDPNGAEFNVGTLNIGDKLALVTDGEGGNIRIISPAGTLYEIDAFNGSLRVRNASNGKTVDLLDKNGNSHFPGTVSAPYFTGKTDNSTVTYTSGDVADASVTKTTGWTTVAPLATGEKHSVLFNKISLMMKNLRFLWKLLGSTSIASIGDGTVTGAISQLNTDMSAHKIKDIGVKTETVTLTYNTANYLNYSAELHPPANSTILGIVGIQFGDMATAGLLKNNIGYTFLMGNGNKFSLGIDNYGSRSSLEIGAALKIGVHYIYCIR